MIDLHPENGFSVVIPLFNKARFIRQTIATVLGQTLPPREIIVVNDGSSDGGDEIVKQAFGDQVRLINQPNAGPGPARNRGVADASTKWVAFLDADDLWRPDHLATLADLAADFPQAAVLSTSFIAGHARPAIEPRHEPPPAGALLDYFAQSLDERRMWTSCIAVERTRFLVSGGFGAFVPGEDLDLWVRLALTESIAASSAVTAIYVRDTEGLMEQHVSCGHELQPVFAVLAEALADDTLRPRHDAIGAFRGALVRRNLRQALYRCDPQGARAYRRDLRAMAGGSAGAVGMLAFLPRIVLRAGLSLRRRLKARR